MSVFQSFNSRKSQKDCFPDSKKNIFNESYTDIQGRSQTSYINTTPCHGAQFRVFVFLPTIHAETNANKMRPRSSRAVRRFTRVYFYAQTARHTQLSNHGYFDRRKKPEYPKYESPYRDKNGTGSGISLVYLWHDLKCRIPAEHLALILPVTSS